LLGARGRLRHPHPIDGAAEIAERRPRLALRPQRPHAKPQRLVAAGEQLPGRRIATVERNPGLQALGQLPQLIALIDAGLDRAQRRLRAQEQLLPPADRGWQRGQHLRRSGRVAAGDEGLGLQHRDQRAGDRVGLDGSIAPQLGQGGVAGCRLAQLRGGQRRGVQSPGRGPLTPIAAGGLVDMALLRNHVRFHEHVGTRAHQFMHRRAHRRGRRLQRQPRARLGQAFDRQRVAAQVREAARIVQARRVIHLVEHRRHAGR